MTITPIAARSQRNAERKPGRRRSREPGRGACSPSDANVRRVGGAAPPAPVRCSARSSLRALFRGDPPLKATPLDTRGASPWSSVSACAAPAPSSCASACVGASPSSPLSASVGRCISLDDASPACRQAKQLRSCLRTRAAFNVNRRATRVFPAFASSGGSPRKRARSEERAEQRTGAGGAAPPTRRTLRPTKRTAPPTRRTLRPTKRTAPPTRAHLMATDR